MKIKLNYIDIKEKYSDEVVDLFREFIDAVLDEETFNGGDPEPFDLIDITAEIEIEIETKDEYLNQSGMTDRNGNDLLKDEDLEDDDYEDEGDDQFNDFSDDDIDNIL